MKRLDIRHVMEHVEVFIDNEFMFSSDTEQEAYNDLKEYDLD